MKVLILAGGFGTRLSEETDLKPKPMVEIGGMPIIWHIMKLYSSFGLNDFIILLGYKGYVIKEYFLNYYIRNSSVTVDLSNNETTIHHNASEPWKITLLDTGLDSLTGTRILKTKDYIDDENFLLTYGDGLSNVNINDLISFHKKNKKIVTLTAVQPQGRYGALSINENLHVEEFVEKPTGDGSWINGGFFVCSKAVFEYFDANANEMFEEEPLKKLAKENQLAAFKHAGFWQCMDTLRDKNYLSDLWDQGAAPWIIKG